MSGKVCARRRDYRNVCVCVSGESYVSVTCDAGILLARATSLLARFHVEVIFKRGT